MMSRETRLVLGTAQLGMEYGVANSSGRPDRELACRIVAEALENGIVEFDTARAYGDSESVLGECLRICDAGARAKVISKVSVAEALGDVEEIVSGSIQRLGVKRLDALLLHSVMSAEDWGNGALKALRSLLEKDLVGRVGVTVYSAQVALEAVETDGISVIQVPGNIFDRRFEKKDIFEKAARLGKTVYVRSVFLQGLALMNERDVPQRLSDVKPLIQAASGLSDRFGMDRLSLSLAYAREAYAGCGILFGAELPEQVRQNVEAFGREVPQDFVAAVRAKFPSVEDAILDPSQWRAK